jgi:hypothetical protein
VTISACSSVGGTSLNPVKASPAREVSKGEKAQQHRLAPPLPKYLDSLRTGKITGNFLNLRAPASPIYRLSIVYLSSIYRRVYNLYYHIIVKLSSLSSSGAHPLSPKGEKAHRCGKRQLLANPPHPISSHARAAPAAPREVNYVATGVGLRQNRRAEIAPLGSSLHGQENAGRLPASTRAPESTSGYSAGASRWPAP